LRDSAANLGYRIGKQRNRDDIGEQIIVHCGIQRDRPLFQLMAHVGHADSLGRFIAKSCRSPASKSHQLKGFDPSRSLTLAKANGSFRIVKRTLPTKRSLCAAAVSSIVRYLLRKQT
jgi:hypothetical protein